MARRKRAPGTWRHMKVHRGPDSTTHWAGPAFTLKSRAKAAQSITGYLDLFSVFSKVQILGNRHQRVRKFAVAVMCNEPGLIIRLFMGGDLYFFVQEQVHEDSRTIVPSITYDNLHVAKDKYERRKVLYRWTEAKTLPKLPSPV